jgi:dihydroxyacetone kinase
LKKLINDVDVVIPEMLAGLAALNPGLALLAGRRIIVRSDARTPAALERIAIISGGGSGHEPAHGGYVGPGMLSAAVAGEVFTSPSTDTVLEAIRAVGGPMGVLLIVKNYTGDRLNFGLAAELARTEGIEVEMVVVADDVALAADGPHAGRRGLAGTVLIHKIAGAAAAEGRPLAEVTALARAAASGLGTMGVSLGACTVPAAGKPGFELADDEIEWGLGIHGEPGVRRGQIEPADSIVAHLLSRIIEELSLDSTSRTALLVNNLGGTPPGELAIVAGSATRYLADQGIRVERAWSGTFLTALEMAGCSISLLKVDDQRLGWLDAAARTTAWPSQLGSMGSAPVIDGPAEAAPTAERTQTGSAQERLADGCALRRAIEAVCNELLAAEAILTDLDQRVGDGDLGVSLSRAAHAISEEIDTYPPQTQPGTVLKTMSATVRRVVGGTSGPLYAVFLLRAASALGSARPTAIEWAAAFRAAVAAVIELGGAQPGDRTMVDALQPAAETFAAELTATNDWRAALAAAVRAAASGAAQTATLTPRLGRSSYVGERALGVPDPGAHAVSLWLAAIQQALADQPG